MIYFVQAGDGGPIKIGRAQNVRQRIKDLQCAHFSNLRLLLTLSEKMAPEWALHRKFAEYRQAGEWFAPGPELLAYIAKPMPLKMRRYPKAASIARSRWAKRDRGLVKAIMAMGIPGFPHVPGNMRRLADALKISRAAVSRWNKIPDERVLAVEKVTGVPRRQLRPDLFRK